ncbi:hypothetical protein ACI2KR_09000 [Pseudomonas luteola]
MMLATGLNEVTNMDEKLINWRKNGNHLPLILKDFHDQKKLFKTMHQLLEINPDSPAKNITWLQGHVYVMDNFLWFMARHGYTLQKSRAKQNFDDIRANISSCTERERKLLLNILLGMSSNDETKSN